MKLSLLAAVAAGFAMAPAAAQNTAEPVSPPPPPPAKSQAPPPATSEPPPAESPAPEPEPAPVVVVPQPTPVPAPIEPVTIDPDAAYPEGFADPADPFANDLSLSYRRDEGFDWGLLGLLGLIGLAGLLRGRDGRRTVYVERDEPRYRAERDVPPPRRTVRDERDDI